MRIFAIICCSVFAICCGLENKVEKLPADLLIQGAVVIHPEAYSKPVVEDVVVLDGKIIDVGTDLSDKYEASKVYEARGRFLIPGLADMHSHFGNGIPPRGKDDTKQVLARHLYFGNTTILNLGSSQAWPARIDELRSAMKSGDLKGPRLHAVGTLMTVPGAHLGSISFAPE